MNLSNSSILKMNDKDTVRFVELYENERLLWNPVDPKYYKKEARKAAAERVAAQLNIDNFTAKHVIAKFKNLRSSYLQEIKKIKISTKFGCSTDDVYVPKVTWFPILDRFLKSHAKSRNTHSNLNDTQMQDTQDKRTQDTQDSSSELDSDVTQQVQPINQFLLSRKNESQMVEAEYQLNTPSTLFKRMALPAAETVSYSPSQILIKRKKQQAPNNLAINSKMKKCRVITSNIASSNESSIDTALQKLDTISSRAQTSLANQNHEDHLDHFGKYIVSMLRNVPASKSFLLQQNIISLVIQAQMPLPVPPELATETSTTEDVTSGSFSDHYQR